jgi:hypothetical protein
MVLVGESDFVKDFDTAWAKMLHRKNSAASSTLA